MSRNIPLMPKATAVWLVENTTLTFEQIAEFCGLHPLEVQGIADGDVAQGIMGMDPVARGLLHKDMLEAAIEDSTMKLKMMEEYEHYIGKQKKVKNRYTPVARRQDKPDAIAWIVKNHPGIKDAVISKLIGTTKSTIAAIRNREHWNMNNIRPRDPVLLGLCLQSDLQMAINRMEKEKAREEERLAREEARKEREKAKKAEEKKKAKEAAAKKKAGAEKAELSDKASGEGDAPEKKAAAG